MFKIELDGDDLFFGFLVTILLVFILAGAYSSNRDRERFMEECKADGKKHYECVALFK